MSCKRVAEVIKVLKWRRRVVGFYGSGQEEKLQSSVVLRRRPSGEAVEYCYLKSCWRAYFVRSQVDYKELSRLTVSSCQNSLLCY